MLRNLLKKLTNNLGLKILALLFATAMWMAVVNLDDPTINKPFTVAVTVENEQAISDMGKYFEIDSEYLNASFNVLGKRSIIDKLNNSDFKATADMSRIIQGEDENVVPIEIVALRNASQLTISKRTQQIKVNLEDLMTKPFVIQASAQGKPAEGYALGSAEVTPNLLRVSGPRAVVSKIDRVVASVDVSGMSTEISDSVVPILQDEDGKRIDTTRLSLNLSTVTVKVDIMSEKAVPIKVDYTGKPAQGFEVIKVTTEPAQISIKGQSDILNAISAITIPEGLINVDDVDEPFKQQVDITKYLPDGVSLSNSAEASVTVTIDVEELERRNFAVPVENIDIDNMPEDYRIEFNADTVNIAIYGLAEDLDKLEADAIRPILDVQDMSAGSHVGQLKISLDNKYIVADTTISYTLYTNNDDDSDGDGPSDTDDGGDDQTSASEETMAKPSDQDDQKDQEDQEE